MIEKQSDNIVKHNQEYLIKLYNNDEEKLIVELVNSIIVFLTHEVEIDYIFKYRKEFEIDCKKSLKKIFKEISNQENNFLIFPDIIPGFTTISYKKNIEKFKIKNTLDLNKLQNNSENLIFNTVLESFFKKNNNTVLVINSNDLLLAFCPVSNFDEYMKEFLEI